jgi:hypothetical protein
MPTLNTWIAVESEILTAISESKLSMITNLLRIGEDMQLFCSHLSSPPLQLWGDNVGFIGTLRELQLHLSNHLDLNSV